MLADRNYMRRPAFGQFWSAATALMVANAAVFIVQLFLRNFSRFPTGDYLALSLEGLRRGYVWELLTFQFMHAGWLHLFLNCWGLYVFGRELEEALGRKSF